MSKLVRLLLGFVSSLGLVAGLLVAGPALGAQASPGPQVAEAGGFALVKATKQPKISKRCKTKGRVLCIDKRRDKLFYVKAGKVIKTMDARFGCASSRTREGTFRVFRKRVYTVSDLYGSPMPYSMFFSGGQAVHYSSDFARRGYNGCSHGCVNIRAKKTLRYVFNQIKLGDKVVVYRS